jgi:hypothetical protein
LRCDDGTFLVVFNGCNIRVLADFVEYFFRNGSKSVPIDIFNRKCVLELDIGCTGQESRQEGFLMRFD